MKVLIVSDTHGKEGNLKEAIRREQPIDMLIHCGDVEKYSSIERIKANVDKETGDRIRALEALYGLLSEEKAEGAGELYRVLTEAAGEEGGWDDG